jgi:antitoxin (DNA-binding transcriptional repressor) of toxin-antitoxin stability system
MASTLACMTPHQQPLKREVGVRELHDQLSRYVRHAAAVGEVVVTMRGRRVARPAPMTSDDPLADLHERGLVQKPQREWHSKKRASDAERVGERSRRRAAPLVAYFDTSALIRIVLEEDGPQLADELWLRSSSRIANSSSIPRDVPRWPQLSEPGASTKSRHFAKGERGVEPPTAWTTNCQSQVPANLEDQDLQGFFK